MSPDHSTALPGARLRRLLQSGQGALLVPGCADALTARIAEEVGFEALYATGAGISNSLLGRPDVGLATMTEMADQVARICDVVEAAVVADIDTGYGNAINAMRAMRSMERAGAAGVQIEDQVFPKRCGHFSGKAVVSAAEMCGKLKAVLDARAEASTVVIARTDALAVEGLESAVERANLYAELGADLIFVEAPPTREVLAELPRRVAAPLVANMVEGGATPLSDVDELSVMGYRVALFANTALRSAAFAARSALEALRRDGTSRELLDSMIGWEDRQRLVGKPEIDRLETRYAAEEARVRANAGEAET
jgi:2-methylisocitrate lyase-like PEP mutase family enzyme